MMYLPMDDNWLDAWNATKETDYQVRFVASVLVMLDQIYLAFIFDEAIKKLEALP